MILLCEFKCMFGREGRGVCATAWLNPLFKNAMQRRADILSHCPTAQEKKE